MQDQTRSSSYYYQAAMAMVVTEPQFAEQEQLKCPRCESMNTKFCYYNNYNLSQPRHFCKSCRRYWTKGGALRNIPIGGASRKNTKRSSKKTTHVIDNPDPGRIPDSGSSRVSDPTRMTFGLHQIEEQGVKGHVDLGGSFSSLLASNMQIGGIILDGSGWDSGFGLRRSDPASGGGDGGVWTDLAVNRLEERLKG